MSKKFLQGYYKVKNPEKYIGRKAPYARSSWEMAFMRFCDSRPDVIRWSSEGLKIPYRHPFTNQYTNYVPDFLIEYIDKNGKKHVELIEIKPSTQSTMETARSRADQQAVAINAAKWTAAQEWCARKGIKFKVITEDQIFRKPAKRKPRKRK